MKPNKVGISCLCLCPFWDPTYVLFGTLLMSFLGPYLCPFWDPTYVLFGTLIEEGLRIFRACSATEQVAQPF